MLSITRAAILSLCLTHSLHATTLLINAQQSNYTSRPEYIRDHLAHIETLPFDGLVVTTVSASELMSGSIIPYEKFAAEFAPLRGLPFINVKQTFAWMHVDRPADFFDNWPTAVENFRTFARVLRECGITGIFFDNEEYRRYLWNYPENCDYPKTLTEYYAQVRLRGRELMHAMMEEYPNMTFLVLYGPFTSFTGTPPEVVADQTLATDEELRGPLTIGFIEAMSGATRMIDGGTLYSLRTQEDFQTSYNYRKYTFGAEATNCPYLPSYLREYIWPLKISISFGVYDLTFRGPPMNPSVLGPTLTNALRRADDLVWLYSEAGQWNAPGEIPQAYIDAVIRGRAAAADPPYTPSPWVSITRPATESTFIHPASIAITAAASGIDSSIVMVEFFNGATKIGQDLTSPYTLQWAPPSAGTYLLTARASAVNGLTSTSAAATVHVSSAFVTAINFQPSGVTSPVGYFADTGETYANRQNGFTYGWNFSHTPYMRQKTGSTDLRLDTLCQLGSGAVWEIAVPNGSYTVTVAIGDGRFASTHTINVEGVNYWSNKALAAAEYINQTKTVTVSDARLTINNGGSAFEATRVNYVLIAAASSLPRAPGGATAISASPGLVDLRWLDHSSNETAFDIERSATSDFAAPVSLGSVAADVTAYADTTALPGQRYYYRVNGRNSVGSSSTSLANYVDVQWPDTDADRVPDPLETLPFVVGIDDRQSDADGDGAWNAAEFLAGTDALSGSSRLALTQVSTWQGAMPGINLCYPTVAGRRYFIEFNPAVSGGVWTLLPGTEVVGDGATHCHADTPGRDRYYRVQAFRP